MYEEEITVSGVWFTSDTHYHHANICRGTSKWRDSNLTRDFDSISAMNDALVGNINARVRQEDVLYHLGDWSFGGVDKIEEFRRRLIVRRIHLILGNHDHHLADGRFNELFTSVQHYKEIEVEGRNIVLCHYAMRVWNGSHKGTWMLYGHSHGTILEHGMSMDVGVDTNHLLPYSFAEVKRRMQSLKPEIVDHHNELAHQ